MCRAGGERAQAYDAAKKQFEDYKNRPTLAGGAPGGAGGGLGGLYGVRVGRIMGA